MKNKFKVVDVDHPAFPKDTVLGYFKTKKDAHAYRVRKAYRELRDTYDKFYRLGDRPKWETFTEREKLYEARSFAADFFRIRKVKLK